MTAGPSCLFTLFFFGGQVCEVGGTNLWTFTLQWPLSLNWSHRQIQAESSLHFRTWLDLFSIPFLCGASRLRAAAHEHNGIICSRTETTHINAASLQAQTQRGTAAGQAIYRLNPITSHLFLREALFHTNPPSAWKSDARWKTPSCVTRKRSLHEMATGSTIVKVNSTSPNESAIYSENMSHSNLLSGKNCGKYSPGIIILIIIIITNSVFSLNLSPNSCTILD